MSELFARVRPLVGDVLATRRVGVMGAHRAGVLVEYLVACGVRQWVTMAGDGWVDEVEAQVAAQYGAWLDVEIARVATTVEMAGVDLAMVVDDGPLARQLPMTLARLAIFTPTMSRAGCAVLAWPGEALVLPDQCAGVGDTDPEIADTVIADTVKGVGAGWAWLTSAPLMALMARAWLLRETAFAMATWEDGWAQGARVYCVGNADDPTQAFWHGCNDGDPATWGQNFYHTPRQRRGTLLVVGLGSLGSVAARELAPWVERLVLVDPDRVEVPNLVRQWYAAGDVGVAKATALARRVAEAQPGVICEAVVGALEDDAQVAALIAHYGVTAALVMTGTAADFAISRGARRAGIPHVVGRCYARARFWEGIVVDGSGIDGAGGPSYEAVRRHVAPGPTPAPTPEEVAAYGAVGELVGEPATSMETGWAAMWLARLMAQMMTPPALREGWLLARLAAGASCFIGGVVVEQGADGVAYGVAVPGAVHAWSAAEIG